jgi:hypothetical protein
LELDHQFYHHHHHDHYIAPPLGVYQHSSYISLMIKVSTLRFNQLAKTKLELSACHNDCEDIKHSSQRDMESPGCLEQATQTYQVQF